MASEIYCTLDNFAASLEHILEQIDNDVVRGVPIVVMKGAQKARKLTKDFSEEESWHHGITHMRYVAGWQYTVKGRGREVSAEIGNRSTPGLPHLLEFGHAQVGGGRTTVYKHIEPAAEQAFDYLFDEMEDMVVRALK